MPLKSLPELIGSFRSKIYTEAENLILKSVDSGGYNTSGAITAVLSEDGIVLTFNEYKPDSSNDSDSDWKPVAKFLFSGVATRIF